MMESAVRMDFNLSKFIAEGNTFIVSCYLLFVSWNDFREHLTRDLGRMGFVGVYMH